MNLTDYIRLFRRNWLPFTLLLVLGMAGGYAYSAVQSPVYSASAGAYVSTDSGGSVADLSTGNTYIQQVVTSYENIATSSYVLRPVIERLGLHESPHQLAQRVSASVPAQTSVLDVTVQDGSAQQAARIANEVVNELSSAVVTLTPRSSTSALPVKVTLIEPAVAPTAPVSPKVPVDVALGALLGLIAAAVVSVAADALNTKLKRVDDLAADSGSTVLGVIPFDRGAASNPLLVGERNHGRRAEAFRSFRNNLQFAAVDQAQPVIAVTSSVESEGKSTSASNLAISLADLGRRVLLVDADLRRPMLATYLGIDGSVGLTDVLIGRVELNEALQEWGPNSLRVLPAGAPPPNPNELLQSERMAVLLGRLRSEFDLIVFDTPPVGRVSDAAVLGRQVDGVVMVAAAGRVRRAQIRQALLSLHQADVRVLGFLATMVRLRERSPYYLYEGAVDATAEVKPAAARRIARRSRA